jgi:arylsulfatase A-like enzyme
MPLDRLKDGEVEIALYLDVGKGQDAICAVSEVGLLSDGERFLPSVLLITSDTHRGDHLGAMDLGVEVKTPTLDALAQRGVLFTNCFSPTNSTNPSHASLLTGIHPRDTGILNNNTRLAATAQTLPERFRDAGYRTWAVVSARHLLDDMSGLGQGFDRMEAPKREARGAEETLEVLDGWLEAAGDEPAFVWLHLFDVHSPYQPPGRFDRMYYPPGKDPYDPSLPDHGVRAEILQREHKGVRDLEFSRAQYRGEVSYLDEQLREVLDRRRFREGVVAFLADHGESLGEHGIWFGHAGLYPGTIHIPLILSWPGAPAGARVDAPAIHMDLGRTLLDLAGLERESFPGRDLRELAGEASSEAVRKAVSQPRFALGHAREASITVGSHHMILQMRGFHGIVLEKPRRAHEVELYDLARDPGCDHNLVDEQPERARRMRALLVQWLQEAQPLGLIADKSNDPELLRGLAQLGYAMDDGGTGPARASLWQEDDCDWCRRFR